MSGPKLLRKLLTGLTAATLVAASATSGTAAAVRHAGSEGTRARASASRQAGASTGTAGTVRQAPPARRGGTRVVHGHHHRGGYYYPYRHYPYYGYYGYYGYPWASYGFWGWPYDYGWYEPAPRPYYVVRPSADAPGAIETKVSPKRAEVRIDGQVVGQARDFNKRWEALWVEPGEHVVEFEADGYMVLRAMIDVRPGGYYRIDERLQKGSGLDPRSADVPALPPVEQAVSEPDARMPATSPAAPSKLERGLLRLSVQPDDAAVYLDGEFLARAGELAQLHGALAVARGVHVVEVVQPGYVSQSREVRVEGDEPVKLEITLERESR